MHPLCYKNAQSTTENHLKSSKILLGGFLFLALFGCQKKEDVSPAQTEVKPPAQATREDLRAAASAAAGKIVTEANGKKVVDLRSFASREKKGKVVRRKVSDFYALHLGLPNVKNGVELPDSLEVSFDANLAKLWHSKVLREAVSDSTLGKTPMILDRYLSKDRGYTDLRAFIAHTDLVVSKAKKSLDWNKLCARYRMTADGCKVLKSVTSKLGGRDFIAYGMTELFPMDGRLNVLYLEMLLKNAGTSYLMHVPARHDNLLSLGFYQFTSFALRRDEEETEGASIVNGFVKEGGVKIPDSVAYLVGDDHHVAAVYFAVHNLAKMIGKLKPKGVKLLASQHLNKQGEMVMFIASAHHQPVHAWKATARWIEGGMKGSIYKSYPPRIQQYALKTHTNMLALSEWEKKKK